MKLKEIRKMYKKKKGWYVAEPISMSTPQMNLCEWEQPKQYEGTKVR